MWLVICVIQNGLEEQFVFGGLAVFLLIQCWFDNILTEEMWQEKYNNDSDNRKGIMFLSFSTAEQCEIISKYNTEGKCILPP